MLIEPTTLHSLPHPNMKVFVSSTYKDLIVHREKAAQAIERLGQQGVRMEVFGARPFEPTQVCSDELDASDAVIG
ncbi:MAG: DUF4062 domain-containing protein, partial [Longimicrobiaceae bacterium]